jgi:hypothetical protein
MMAKKETKMMMETQDGGVPMSKIGKIDNGRRGLLTEEIVRKTRVAGTRNRGQK